MKFFEDRKGPQFTINSGVNQKSLGTTEVKNSRPKITKVKKQPTMVQIQEP